VVILFSYLRGFIMTNEYTKAQQAIVNAGTKAAESFTSADLTASNTKREVILQAAIKYAGDVALTKLWLEGFAIGFEKQGQSVGTAKVRKAEANAVFKAVAKSEVSEGNIMQLSDAKGLHYNQWIELARELGGKNERVSSTKERKAPEKMAAGQYDKVQELLNKASPEQLGEVATQAVLDINKKAPVHLAGFQTLLLIQAAATSLLKNPECEEFFKDVAVKIQDLASVGISHARKAQESAEQVAESAAKASIEPEPETM
jgi:hypothetical protein